ncbi:DEHA2G06248p [Debaryomyces hansenii CBS767]|uniref:SAGA complex subunit Spt7 n=1 Tax=Debaryomyces hansenii (strain ATCC 36239 / CBS 767 / BCRC 21394 / JCM 1990 / NBRC 0083 / IGC 2968) TaxID=284592 RepID=Q6BJ02_DEBHA|nr:DEHA2G06248p [Debaryomyces hansenii CBS767]CAG90280.2 DEHA2G06248p [Debaryomyces hansenii CBS767]|eukprot:XP_461819.2 DEHA2G06248p [Debaryomyces hansenii CBS767]
MEKLSAFQINNKYKLFQLAKDLNSTKFFETCLNDNQYKIISYLLSTDNYELWSNFLEGNCYLQVNKSPTTEESDQVDEENEEVIEEGHKPIKMLALHIRYLLWEKAIDFYYSSKDLDQSVYTIEEVTDDYELIDKLDKVPEENVTNGEGTENDSTSEAKAAPIAREEEDDYDDEEEEEEEEEKKEEETDKKNVHNSEDHATSGDVTYNDDHQAILEVPSSLFEEKPEPETNTELEQPSTTESRLNIEEQENLIKEFNKVYHNFEYDRETLIKRRKLEKSDMQLEEAGSDDIDGIQNGTENMSNMDGTDNMVINLGSASLSLKHLLQTIQQQRDEIPLNDFELRTLFMDVRKNRGKWANDERVGQEELYEACEKVVMDLRGYTEHSTPFLNKVSKREAPNYGLIIKTPMDLNTVMKKLKGLQYNSKEEFVNDLMLIWNNCLTYNVDPKHFLRAHAIAMQRRTQKLIPSIPNITIRSRADVEKEEELENEEKGSPIGAGKSSKKGRKRTREDQIKTEDETNNESPDPSSLSETPATGVSATEAPFVENENKKTDAIDQDNEEEEEEADPDVREDNDNDNNDDEDEVGPELQAWRTLTAKSRAHYCAQRAGLFDDNYKLKPNAEAIIRESNEMSNFNHYLNNTSVVSKSSNLLENDEPYLLEYDITGGLPGFKYSGVNEEDEERREQRLVDVYLQQADGDASKIKSPFVLPTDSGLNKVYLENISEMQEIRKICFKISLIRQMQTQSFVHHTQLRQPEIDALKEVDVDPVSKLSNHDPFHKDIQYSILRRNISKIAMQTGYETTQPPAINTLTQLAERYMENLIKSIKLHSESSSSNKLTTREILLLSLLENGIDKPDDLYTFVKEKIVKQQAKLKDLRVKLSNFLKELLKPGLENFNEKSFDDNSEQFMTGDFSNDLGDDFFGFKELGLDKEYKMLSSSIPIYLLHSRLHNSYSANGIISKRNKYEDLKEYNVPKLYASDIENQIGILTPFYSKLLDKSKHHFVKVQKKKGESTTLPENDKLVLIEDEELPQKQRNVRPRLPPTGKITSTKKKIIANSFILPDEEELAVS